MHENLLKSFSNANLSLEVLPEELTNCYKEEMVSIDPNPMDTFWILVNTLPKRIHFYGYLNAIREYSEFKNQIFQEFQLDQK